eukprot:gnl/Hemi2/4159_TR1443_c0_g1_i1.p1 gnl/Hemi2/4159_TR1443_c0_g1~~gnl/Hemi2/4159_TR1443_c0_g1_i1.p1  ORF type:complete len:638 (-),score=206.21 gnl/Hemi2/4159_TR1443_c0_g1_i1:67-1980(-)
MVQYNFKKLRPVPTAKDFVDIVLSKTQRKTPTIVHRHYPISRIRQFYMRKVRFTSAEYHDRLTVILDDFPRIEDIHPFYADLMNVLYDRDHYKLALGQLSVARSLCDNLGKDYVRLLKFGDSLYRCKQLKRAALGRMCTLMRKHTSALSYLEQVRQHLARLPCIDPTARTLLITGYPNVGKSSFMNKLTRANVEVQPYAFTTKSLFVGHTDHEYLRYQVIDTPGILDHPLDDRNTIEMQAITALAHLRACVLYFIDVSEQCGWTIPEQVSLFNSIKPLFVGKPLLVVLNKIDVVRPDDLPEEHKLLLQAIGEEGARFATMSTLTEEGIANVKTLACQATLEMRVTEREKTGKVASLANRLTVTLPQPRDDRTRECCIPESVMMAMDQEAEARKTEKDYEQEAGGAGQYNVDMRKHWQLANSEWAHDVIPEIMDGRNIADFIDPDIMERMEQLEREEEERERQADEAGENIDALDNEEKELIQALRDRKKIQRELARVNRTKKSRISDKVHEVARSRKAQHTARQQQLKQLRANDPEKMDEGEGMDSSRVPKRKRSSSAFRSAELTVKRKRGMSTDQSIQAQGFKDIAQKTEATKLYFAHQRSRSRDARKGEGDHHVPNFMPKHLFSGKRGIGKNERR